MKKYLQMLLIFIICLAFLPYLISFTIGGSGIPPGLNSESKMQDESDNYSKSDNEPYKPTALTIDLYDIGLNKAYEMLIEEYVCAVVYASMPASFGPDALKAQAVAVRSIIYYRLAQNEKCPTHDADFCTDGSCCLAFKTYEMALDEVSQDVADSTYDAVAASVTATAGEYLEYSGRPANALFHASSSGRTESSAAVIGEAILYLSSVSTPDESGFSMFYNTRSFSAARFKELTGIKTNENDCGKWSIRTVTNASGRCESIIIEGTAFLGTKLMELLGLPSTNFELTADENRLVFACEGVGHGLGMSQYGAGLMALDGYTYREILAHYYPGAAVKTA